MAGVQGVPFAAGGLPASANKEKGGGGGFCWQDAANEAGSTADFFDQYVELGDSDAESACGGGGGLGQFCGASALAASPHLSFGRMLPPGGRAQQHQNQHHLAGGALSGHFPSGSSLNLAATSSTSNLSRGARTRHQQHQQQQQQHLHPLCRTTSNMTGSSNADMGADGMRYGSFGDAPGGGSISDSELLKLEGLTMRSPRIQIPQLSASEPTSPPSLSASPRKAGRLEMFCNKLRTKAANLHTRTKQQSVIKADPEQALAAPIMSTAQMAPAMKPSARPRPQHLQLSEAQVPSPPLSSGMPNPAQRQAGGSSSDASFVNGFLDDPFMRESLLNGQFVPPLQLNGAAMPQTPLQTPLLDAWQLPMSGPNGKPLWIAPGAYFTGVDGDAPPGWWDPSADAMDTDPVPLSFHASANARNASLNLAIQPQHQPSFEYSAPPGTDDAFAPAGGGGLMLQSDAGHHRPTRADHHHHHRRPKPRAPSSGARHHTYGPGMSPRKTRTASDSGSTSASRLGSASPSPKLPAAAVTSSSSSSSGRRLHRRSASMQTLNQPLPADTAAVRKRRSWTGRRASSSSLHHQYHSLAAAAAVATTPLPHPTTSSSNRFSTHPLNPTTTTASTSCPLPTKEEAQRSADGFVNYTPQDRTLLMTGVAPSGSSKTKARREREAAERQREFRDRLARVVRAAGGDVSKIEGFVGGVANEGSHHQSLEVGGGVEGMGMGMGIQMGMREGGGGYGKDGYGMGVDEEEGDGGRGGRRRVVGFKMEEGVGV